MTPDLFCNPHPHLGNDPHLTDDQFAALLASPGGSPGGNDAAAEAHLVSCELCTAELDGMRESLSFFRDASVACANTVYADQVEGKPREWVVAARRPQLLHPAFWAAAAAMLLTAVLLPLQLHRQAAAVPFASNATAQGATSTRESDEALLEDVNRDLSASVPAPMQTLADPTGGEDSALLLTPIETSGPIAIAPSGATLTSAQRKN
jgi:hypothetical protein